jgi:hypothetical protein
VRWRNVWRQAFRDAGRRRSGDRRPQTLRDRQRQYFAIGSGKHCRTGGIEVAFPLRACIPNLKKCPE